MENRFVSRIGKIARRGSFFLLIFCMLFSGCVSNHTYDFKSKKTIMDLANHFKYKKKIGILPAANSSHVKGMSLGHLAEANFADQIFTKCHDILLVDKTSFDCPDFLVLQSSDNFFGPNRSELIQFARNAGLTALVLQNIRDVGVYKCNKGFIWFKKSKQILKARITATVLDVLTGTILCIHTEEVETVLNDEIPVGIELSESFSNILLPYLDKIFLESAKTLGRIVGESLFYQQWSTTIDSISKGKIVLPVGEDVGINIGDRFAIFCGKRTITGQENQTYFVPGYKIGEITIIGANYRHAYGEFTGGEVPVFGDIVIPIKD